MCFASRGEGVHCFSHVQEQLEVAGAALGRDGSVLDGIVPDANYLRADAARLSSSTCSGALVCKAGAASLPFSMSHRMSLNRASLTRSGALKSSPSDIVAAAEFAGFLSSMSTWGTAATYGARSGFSANRFARERLK